MIGFSGLIIFLLEEMVYVVMELEKVGLDILLLIGGVIIFKLYIVLKIVLVYYVLVVYLKDVL